MARRELLGIGAFSLLTGISVSALRHYDEVGVLPPAHVDPDSGYRYYAVRQISDARLVRALRNVDVPLELVRAIIDAGDPSFTQSVLRSHRQELAGRNLELARMLDDIDLLIERGTAMTTANASRIVQVKIHVDNLQHLVDFYESAFGATYDEGISSFAFGAYGKDSFFLLTADEPAVSPACFGLLVDEIDEAHARSVAAGATEVFAPADSDWKPRCSRIGDPSGNVVDLYQR